MQSVDGYVTGRGIDLCAELLDLSTAEVSGVATFYTQYKRHPNGTYTVGVCTNTLCAVMGGDEIWDAVSEHLGIGHDETTADGTITLERVECNAACDFAPVVMTNWEFFDNQTPASTIELVDALRAGEPVAPTRGPKQVGTFKEVSRVLAGFSDGLADEGVGAGSGIPGGTEDRAGAGLDRARGRLGEVRLRRRRPAQPGQHRGDPRRTTRPRPTRPPRRRRRPRPPARPRSPARRSPPPVTASAAWPARCPRPADTVDPVPPQESEPDEVGRAANVSAQSASVPAKDPAGTKPPTKTTKKKGS